MIAVIEPGNFSGSVTPPSSKSITQRAYAAALLHTGRSIIHYAGVSDDEAIALQIIQQLGAKIISQTEHTIEIESNGVHCASDHIHCGESGLSARLFTPIAALSGEKISISGGGSLLNRPMHGFDEVFPQLDVVLHDFKGHLPFGIQGPIQPRSVKIDAAEGSQFLSGLLFSLSACVTEPITIDVAGLKSKPYIDLTLDILKHTGKLIAHDRYKKFFIDPAKFEQKETIKISVAADWSSAVYFLVAGAIAGDVTVHNLPANSMQADEAILDVLRMAGALVCIDGDTVSVKMSNLQAFEFDATHCPDLFPALAVLGACCEGESHIKGVHRLFHKESNRVESITEMLQSFAVPWGVEEDTLIVTGVQRLQGAVIDAYNDHRIVMAAAVAALRANGPVEIAHAGVVSKSYPAFFKDFILCGARCTFK